MGVGGSSYALDNITLNEMSWDVERVMKHNKNWKETREVNWVVDTHHMVPEWFSELLYSQNRDVM